MYPDEAFFHATRSELALLDSIPRTSLSTDAFPRTVLHTGASTYTSNTAYIDIPDLPVDIVLGDRVKVLAGLDLGKETQVVRRVDDTTLEITPFVVLESSFTVEVYRPADTYVSVENALAFPETGSIVIDGVVYAYTSKTPTAFVLDGNCNQLHTEGTEVLLGTESGSLLDALRLSFSIEDATEESLDRRGRNVNIERVTGMDDDTYRAIIQNIAYTPRGRESSLQRLLDILYPDTGILLVDNTADADEHRENAGSVRLGLEAGSVSKEAFASVRSTDVVVTSNEFDVPNAENIVDVRGPDLPANIAIQTGTGYVRSTDGITVELVGDTFSADIQSADILRLHDGSWRRVVSRDSDTELTIGQLAGYDAPPTTAFAWSKWNIERDPSLFYIHRPDVARWTYTGSLDEILYSNPSSSGLFLNIAPTLTEQGYISTAKPYPQDNVQVSTVWGPGVLTDTDLQEIHIVDGHRAIALAIYGDSSGLAYASFMDMSDQSLLGDTYVITTSASSNNVRVRLRIEKQGERAVTLYAAGLAITTVLYEEFPLISAVSELSTFPASYVGFGYLAFDNNGDTGGTLIAEQFGVAIERNHSLRTFEVTATQVDAATLDFSTNAPAIGDRIVITDSVNTNASGGYGVGVWEVLSIPSADQAALASPTYSAGYFVNHNTVYLPHGFTEPDALGGQLEIVGGAYAGTYDIDDVVLGENERAYRHSVALDITGIPGDTFDYRYIPLLPTGDHTVQLLAPVSLVSGDTYTVAFPDFVVDGDTVSVVEAVSSRNYLVSIGDAYSFIKDNFGSTKQYFETVKPSGCKIYYDGVLGTDSGKVSLT